MKRTQVQFTKEQARRLERLASERGISVSELVRSYVDRGLETEDSLAVRYERARKLLGTVSDPNGPADLSTDHDRYLDESYGS